MIKLFNWLTNKHWEGNNKKAHYFCFKNHYGGIKYYEDGTKKSIHGYSIKLFGIVVYNKEFLD